MAERPHAEAEIDGRPWVLYDAWRSSGGLGLGYFLCRDGGGWCSDRLDRRAVLDPDVNVDDLDADGIATLHREAVPLTPTERRLEGASGTLWLVQAVGPVWSESGASSDAVGMTARPINRDGEVRTVPGVDPTTRSDGELAALLSEGDAQAQ